ncbi:Similar to tpsp: Bifunctional trehalose-6-phosphate synthase/phosphatase (Thermoproteus tenax (strain ATCC 35583 / DSM 2078 / JCM 9277 / NBRC 100435 / Kra 1)) [Cotesia congregata]|uniref:Similar to tpsp: Bifunctional trehalose-6-phosphate synthase/phosphatase (Thermoproteus tenax (Strain ATCC 35583 / DSM 2078 / JCM 9277 / NBRC 100435 / Kra 1)) n=1 Tax=Cotesia congregata TaxID=51543 RepID=A0A8J2HGB5_COTCN|nr:Similar to tpsp: Bifunctional trehalose-6-phosphate synthase/phosphatase (Thermoproteus tenax (strain ATCC 35583 / DSM 2078 / JCM 9277 / NBRC 100435 / Kra 1)) [Cotesia congregata]
MEMASKSPFRPFSERLKTNKSRSFSSNGSMIVVSNRLPFVLKRNEETGKLERKSSAGGLVTAVAPVVINGNGIWVGWPGMHMEDVNEQIPESDPNDKTPTAGLLSSKVVAVHVEPDKFDAYYNGSCNGTFWPLFHSMPDRATFNAEHWRAYVAVNEEFAAKTVKALEQIHEEQKSKPNGTPLVWVHDYHLMLAANWIRQAADEKNLKLKLGFFLHIPFPPWDIFRLFPWADEILQGMLGCDMVGFHIQDYCLNFVDCCQRCLGGRVDRKNLLVDHGGRTVRVRPLPIGIPFDRFVSLAEAAPKVIMTNLKIVLGVDRLDYTKGLVHRLKAFEMLLEKHPEHREQVTMLQIAVPSRTDVREYQELKLEMEQLIGSINGRFTTPNWSPIRYIYGCVSQDELAGFYRDSAVALVTPLRDGMNLVAKEFVACQINTPPGVLIVSPFAGAGEMMHEALICNPYEIDEAAEVIHRALTMPEDERTLRMNYLRRRERIYDVNYWMKSFLQVMGSLEEHDSVGATVMQPVTMDDFDDYLSKSPRYIGDDHKLALLLDYDGTLAPIATHPDLAILPLETKNVLQRLSNMPDVYIAIISGRNVNNVKSMVGIEGITYAGNHGLEILHPDGSKFVHPMPVEFEGKVGNLMQLLQDQQAKKLIEEAGFKACSAHCAIEAKPPVEWNKGRASIYILRTAFGLDWSERIRIIYAGDDATDEDAMKALKGMAATFRITSSHIVRTSAERRLPSTDSVLTMLKWVERHLGRRKPRNNSLDISNRFRRSSGGVTMEMSFTEPQHSLAH